METSFALWLEARDPEFFVIVEAEFKRRDRSPLKRGLLAGAATTAALAGLGWWMGGSGDKVPEPPKKDNIALVKPKTVEAPKKVVAGPPQAYKGSDKEAIFRYATKQSFNGINIFPYNVDGGQEGIIARVSLPKTDTSPLSDDDLQRSYSNFVSQVRHAMATGQGGGVLRLAGNIKGQGNVNWEYIAIGRANPVRGEAGMVEIVLYAQKPLGVK